MGIKGWQPSEKECPTQKIPSWKTHLMNKSMDSDKNTQPRVNQKEIWGTFARGVERVWTAFGLIWGSLSFNL